MVVGGVRLDQQYVMDVCYGKRSCCLDLEKSPEDRSRFHKLLKDADILVCSYRSPALAKLGLSEEELFQSRPGLILVTNSCYGEEGPYSAFGGFEGNAVSATGVHLSEPPSGLGMYCNDYMTGFLMGYGAMVALKRRCLEGGSFHVRASLCQSAMYLQKFGLEKEKPTHCSSHGPRL